MGFINLDAVLLGRESLVHLQERHDMFHVPEVVRRRPSVDVPVHRVFEQDGADNPVAREARAGDDAGSHLMHEIEHLIVVGPGVVLDAVEARRVGVLPPLWSSAAMKPGCDFICCSCSWLRFRVITLPSTFGSA